MIAHQIDHALIAIGLMLAGWWARERRRIAAVCLATACWRLRAAHLYHHSLEV